MKQHMRISYQKIVKTGTIIFSITLNMAPLCCAKEVLMGFGYGKPPYSIGKEKKGIEFDIAREALQYKGHTLKIILLPGPRVTKAIDMGADGAASVPQLNDDRFYSNEFVTFENYAISKKKFNLKINTILDLKDKYIATFSKAHLFLGEEFKSLFSPQKKNNRYKEMNDQLLQNKMFWHDKARVMVIDKHIFLWYRKQLAHHADVTDEVTFHNIFPNNGKTPHFCSFKEKQTRDDFNQGLKHLRESGRYQQIIDKYTQ
ncbi:MAG: amino acid ABC transporter [Candidatus Electrothrix sp. ATG2]|nr:amino acid ABC transporter [Candidatus Electrothrix sp. ATG2]